MKSDADIYTETAVRIIKVVLTTPKGALLWWRSEAPHRSKYGLSQEHVDRMKLAMAQKFGREALKAAA